MAQSLAHRRGQIIGDVFEVFVRNILVDVATRHGLYLDYKRPRPARSGQKVSWQDAFGNKRDLDYVLERGGSDDTLGSPVAFIESAWRRYTKHSKNKVQEIEAAIFPVGLTFSKLQPFCGAVLAGEFTKSALQQLESKGFAVLHIPYGSILSAFQEPGIDASSEDGIGGTGEREFRRKIGQWEALPQPAATNRLIKRLHDLHGNEIATFVRRLDSAINRCVTSVRLTVLRGHAIECTDVPSAIAYLLEEEKASKLHQAGEVRESFESQVRFNNEAKVDATFPSRVEAINFLRRF